MRMELTVIKSAEPQIHETAVVGFMPVKKGHIYYSIDNYFVSGDDPSVLSELLEEVIKDFSSQASLMAVVHKRHVKVFSQKKFQTCVEWKIMIKCIIYRR